MSEILIGPVQGGPCDGATSIVAPESWNGRVRDLPGQYRWNAYRMMWVWKPFERAPKKEFVHVRITESEFKKNAPKPTKRGRQPVSTRDWDLR